jgi:hypothetical protein
MGALAACPQVPWSDRRHWRADRPGHPIEQADVDGFESLALERGSLLVLAGAARYKWRHAIPGRKTDKVGEGSMARGRAGVAHVSHRAAGAIRAV